MFDVGKLGSLPYDIAMPTKTLLDCISPAGDTFATLRITPASNASTIALDPSTQTPQLHENGRYWCELIACDVPDAHLQCSLFRVRAPAQHETWLMETGTHAGTLRIDLIDAGNKVIGAAWADVVSLKLNERKHYRAMLNDISKRMVSLQHDLRASTLTPLVTTWRHEPAALQQQLAFLCEAIESPAFHHAIQRIVTAPHRALQRESAVQPISKSFKQNAVFVQQLASAKQRAGVPAQHPLAARMSSVPACITTSRHAETFDTPENQFMKFALMQMRDFLGHAAKALHAGGVDWQMPVIRAEQNERQLAQWLSHSFFEGLSPLRGLPLGSAVLQRKAGYRDVLQTWLRFQAHAQIAWEGGDEIFFAGQRDTAQLYEYWLFFQLLDAFCARFDVAQPPAQTLIERSANGWLLRLKHGDASPPIIGTANGIHAQFQYNRTFAAPAESWTTSMRPDFTFTFWPAGVTQGEAMAQHRLIHLHFDAKYRVDKFSDLSGFGANRDDLLKMHAYRDAIRHTAGAFVLFPGVGEQVLLRRENDTLSSLGAFGVMPAHAAHSIDDVMALLDDYNRSHVHQLRPRSD